MNYYYILPKNNTPLKLFFSFNETETDTESNQVFISDTLVHSLTYIKNHIQNYNPIEIAEISKNINPYEFIFTNVLTDNTNMSISKIKPSSNIFFELIEIIQSLFLFENPFFNKNVNILHVSNANHKSSIELLINTIRNKEQYNDDKYFNSFDDYDYEDRPPDNIEKVIYDFIMLECIENQNHKIIISLKIILSSLSLGGTAIIKIPSLYHKVVVDFLFIVCNVFEKVQLIKPLVSNILTNEKYIVCNNYQGISKYDFLNNDEYNGSKSVSSLLQTSLPSFFISKIEEFNVIYGQQQLEAYDQLINIINNKNKHDKIEALKKINIQKSIAWCDKYKIPCNKFIEKYNIFLNV
jgi:hypothetical protein